jgi:hypothetical protein
VGCLIAQAMLVGDPGDHGHLPAEIAGAVANALHDVAKRQERQARRAEIKERHKRDHYQPGRGRTESPLAIKELAQDEIGEQAAECARELEHADLRVAGLEPVDQNQCVQRSSHERADAPHHPRHHHRAVARFFG